MAEDDLKQNQKNRKKSNIREAKEARMKYNKNITTGVLVGALAVILIMSGVSASRDKKAAEETPKETTVADDTGEAEETEETEETEKFEVDAYPAINSLITEYYDDYANGKVDDLEKIAYPLSDTEKSYIELFSKYVDKYEDIKCYTKHGAAEDEYIVSVSLSTRFKDIATGAPGLDFFYVRTDDKGNPYIDNAYSQFNQSNQETTTDPEINSRITEYEQDEDVVALQQQIQDDYEKALASESALEEMVKTTIPDAISDWVASVGAAQQTSGDDQTATADNSSNNASDDTQNQQTEEQQTGESSENAENGDSAGDGSNADSKTNVKKRTAYAKTKVNIRKKKSTSSDVVDTLSAGTKITVLGKSEDGWFKVESDSKEGYIKKEYVVFKQSEVEKEDTTANTDNNTDNNSVIYLQEGKQIKLSESVNIRSGMSESADRIGLAYKGDVVTVIMSYAEGWTKVSWKGETGYAKTEFLK